MRLTILILFFLYFGQLCSQDLNFNTHLVQSAFSFEQRSGATPMHVGWSAGLDVIVRDAATVIMPGIHFQKVSVLPDKLDFANPYYKRNDINVIKIPLQVGGFAWKNKYTHLLLTGGPVGTFLLSVDDNPRLNEDDLNSLRAGAMVSASIRILFITCHIQYEYGLTKIYLQHGPSGVYDNSKERTLMMGLGVYF